MKIKKALFSFKPAWNGLKNGLKTENNIKVHLFAATIIIVAGFLLNVSKGDWLWLIAAIGIVLTTEYFNTSIEKLTDLVSPDYNELAGRVKDLSAAAVIIISLTAAIIGVVIFAPYLVNYGSR